MSTDNRFVSIALWFRSIAEVPALGTWYESNVGLTNVVPTNESEVPSFFKMCFEPVRNTSCRGTGLHA